MPTFSKDFDQLDGMLSSAEKHLAGNLSTIPVKENEESFLATNSFMIENGQLNDQFGCSK